MLASPAAVDSTGSSKRHRPALYSVAGHLASDSSDGSDRRASILAGTTVAGCATTAPVGAGAAGSRTCTLCGPAPYLDGPSLPAMTVVCAECATRHGPARARALAVLRGV